MFMISAILLKGTYVQITIFFIIKVRNMLLSKTKEKKIDQ